MPQLLFPDWIRNIVLGPMFYLGPESILPLASIIAAVVGFILMFWRAIVRFIKKILHLGSDQHADITPYIETEEDTIDDKAHE